MTATPRHGSNATSVYEKLGDYQKAIEDYGQAIRLEPGARRYWRSRGLAYVKLSDDEKALADLCKAIELKPEDTWSLRERGLIYHRLGQLDVALSDMSQCIELKPTSGTFLCRAKIYRDRKEFDLALADCQQAIDIDFDDNDDAQRLARATAYVLRGDICVENLQRYEDAIVEYSKAIELEPHNAVYLEKRGKAFQEFGDTERAAADFEEAARHANQDEAQP